MRDEEPHKEYVLPLKPDLSGINSLSERCLLTWQKAGQEAERSLVHWCGTVQQVCWEFPPSWLMRGKLGTMYCAAPPTC